MRWLSTTPGQQLGKHAPGDDFPFERGQDALDEDEIPVRRPGKRGDFPDERVRGDEAVHAGLADARADGLGAGGEVEVDRGFSGEDYRQVGDESALAGWQDDGHPCLVGLGADEFGEREGRGENPAVGDFRVIRAVEDAVLVAMFAQAREQRHGQRAVEEASRTVGFLRRLPQRLLPGGHAGFFRGDRLGEGKNRVRQRLAALDRERGLARAVDGDWQHGQAEGAHRLQVACGDPPVAGVARGGPSGHVNDHAVTRKRGFELLACRCRCGVGGGEHRAGAGFFQIGTQRRIVLGGFLDEPGDGSAGEEFFEQEELLEIEAAGNHQNSRGGNAVPVKDLDG